jgi:ribonucleotide reductase, class II
MADFEFTDFDKDCTTAFPVGYRTYARKASNSEPRESGKQVKERTLQGLFKLGNFTEEEKQNITDYLNKDELFSSGRFMWCGGLEFSEKQENFYSLYNCSSITIETWADLAHNFNFLMQGNGSGAKLEYKNIEKLPEIVSTIDLTIQGSYGAKTPGQENTEILRVRNKVVITVGDSRLSWCDAYLALLELSSTKLTNDNAWDVVVDVSNIREKGAIIKGFGGKTNPSGFIPLLKAVVNITNKAVGRKLKPLEVSLLLNEAASCTVAGNIRRSARIDQFSKKDIESGLAKMNLWTQDSEGNWKIDTEKDALRMANFTRVWHKKPTLDEIKEALTSQFYSAEGAIQFAPEAIARSSVDLLNTPELKTQFIKTYCQDQEKARQMLLDLGSELGVEITEKELDHRMNRYGLNPCGSC